MNGAHLPSPRCLGVLRLDGRGRQCSLEHHLVCVVPLADEHRVDEPEAVIEGSLYHCHLSTIHESTVPAAAGVTDRWPGLKAEYFQDPQTKFQMAPDPSAKSQDDRRKRRTSIVSSSAASSAASAAGDRRVDKSRHGRPMPLYPGEEMCPVLGWGA